MLLRGNNLTSMLQMEVSGITGGKLHIFLNDHHLPQMRFVLTFFFFHRQDGIFWSITLHHSVG